MHENTTKILLHCVSKMLDGANSSADPNVVLLGFLRDGWTIHPVFLGGSIVGGIVEKEGEIHTSISKAGQRAWNPRPYVKKILLPALEKYGVISTKISTTDLRGQSWLKKLGFKEISSDDKYTILELTTSRIK